MASVEKSGVTLMVEDGRFSCTRDKNDKKLGWRDLGLQVITDPDCAEQLQQDDCRQEGGRIIIEGHYPKSKLKEKATLTLTEKGALIVERAITNPQEKSRSLMDVRTGMVHGKGQPVLAETGLWHMKMAHQDNLRTERFPWCRPETPYVRTVPTEATWYGNQENHALPVMIFTNDNYSVSLVEGQLKKDMTRLRWHLQASNKGGFAAYSISHEFIGGGKLIFHNQTLELEPLYFEMVEKTHPQSVWNGYFEEAIKRNTFRSENNIMHSKAFYCSWNYGIMQNFTEESLVKTAKTISEKLPNVPFFLIDGGWQGQEAVNTPDCSNFYLPEEKWVNREKLPNGMDGLAKSLRDLGLRPSIWWTPSVSLSSTLAREHPEWLALDGTGTPHRIGNSGYLDVSMPEVQDYLKKVWDIIFNKWGYEAMKMDFWSHAFESGRIRYRNGTCIEWRDWFLSTLRSFIPEDGFLMTCVSTAQGDIFLGKNAESYRACIDVGNAAWHEHPAACCWQQPLLSIPGRETTLMNADGFGFNQDLSVDENIHRLTYGFICMGSLEVDGRLEELTDEQMELIRRFTDNIDRGYVVKCPDDDAYTGKPFPKVLYVDYPEDSPTYKRGVRKHIAIFNWTDEPLYVGATAAQLGLEGAVKARNYWTDEVVDIPAEGLCEILHRRAAKLYEITA